MMANAEPAAVSMCGVISDTELIMITVTVPVLASISTHSNVLLIISVPQFCRLSL